MVTNASLRIVVISAFLMMSSAAARANGLIPVHGYVLSPLRRGRVIMRLDRVVGMLRGGMYSVDANVKVPSPGTQVDALVVKRPDGLALAGSPTPAKKFVAGVPDKAVKHLIGDGDREPAYLLIDQNGRAFRLSDFKGKVTLLSFIFTRCKDVCLTISSKFQQLQRLLDPRDFHLVEVSIDPSYDSPAVLAAYGRKFDANNRMWTFATGESAVVSSIMNSFGVSSLANGDDDFLHNTSLVMIGRRGVVRDTVQSAGWDPADVAATARALAGLQSNPLRQFVFASFSEVQAFCGGDQSVAVVIILSVAIPFILCITIPILLWFRRRIFSRAGTS